MTELKSKFIYFLGLLTFAIINILAINNYAYDDKGNVQCDNYVLNTYLYVILGFIIMAIVILVDERFNVFANLIIQYGFFVLFGLLAVMIGFVVLLHLTTNQIMSHVYWIVLLLILGLLLSISVQVYAHMDMNIVYMGFIITIVITAVMGFVGFKYGKSFITVDFDKYLKWALVALVIASFANFFLNIPNLWVYLSIAGVIIFSLLIMSYNNKLRENAKTCITPLYPKESFGLIIKIANLLKDVMYLLARSRRR
jgi:FtsH-binding integral membrane protein